MTDKPLNVIGNPLNHDQQALKIGSGRLDFAADRMPGLKFYGAIKSSTIAHARITGFDFSKANNEPGVKAIITYKDCPIWTSDIFQWGQEVAGVVGTDANTAVRAGAARISRPISYVEKIS